MNHRRVSRMALVVLTVALVACSGDNTTPTQPGLGGLASLSGEGGNGGGRGGGGGGGGGGGAQSVYYSMTATGFLETNPIPAIPIPVTFGDVGVSNATKEGSTQVVLLGVPLIGNIFDPGTNSAANDGWKNCFKNLQPGAPTIFSGVPGASLSLFRTNENGTATLRHGMPAFGTDGMTGIGYRLELFGGTFSRPDPWTPFEPIGATTNVTFAAGDAEWVVRVTTKPKGKSKPTACTGSGLLPSTVTFTVTSITDPF